MNNLYITGILFFTLLLAFSGCRKDSGAGCFEGSGRVMMEQRETGGFTSIVLHDNVDLYLTHVNGNNSIMIESGENLIPGIRTELSGGVLTIRNDNWCNWMRSFEVPIRVHVSVGKLDSLEYRGSGNIYCTNDLHNDSLQLEVREGAGSINLSVYNEKMNLIIHSGTADVNIRGNTWVSTLGSHGFGPLNCLDLNSQYTYIYTSSPNHCYVNVSQVLAGGISNAGNVYYRGNPYSVGVPTSGTGQLIRLE